MFPIFWWVIRVIDEKKKERKIQSVHDDEHRKAKIEKKLRCYSKKKKKELYKRGTICKTLAPRPIKKTMLAQIF